MPIIDELITLLGFESDDTEGKEYAGTLGSIKTAAVAVGAAVLAAEGAVLSFTNMVAASTDELGKFGDSFGIDIERLQQFEFATERAGGSADELRGDLANLTKQLASPIPGEFNQGLFLLGVNVKDAAGNLRAADEVLLDLADRFAGYSAQQRQILAQQVGLSESTIRFISQGRGEIERLSRLASELGGILPKEATQIAAEYADRLTDVNLIIGGIGKAVAISLLPGLTRTLATFEAWSLANKEIIKENVQAVVEGLGRGFEFIFETGRRAIQVIADVIPGFDRLADGADIARLVFVSFVSALGILLIAFSPIIAKAVAVGAAIAAVALVIEDFIVFIQGGKSVIGTFFDGLLEKFPSIIPVIENIKSLFIDLVDAVAPVFIGLGVALSETFRAIGDESTALGVIFSGTIDLILGLINDLVTLIRVPINLFRAFATLIAGDVTGAIEILNDEVDRFAEVFSVNVDKVSGWVDALIGKFNALKDTWSEFKESLSIEGLAEAGNQIGAAANKAIEGVSGFVGEKVDSLSKAGMSISDSVNSIFNKFGFSGPEAKEKVVQATQAISAPPAIAPAILAGATDNRIGTNNFETNQTNNFVINGAQSPQATANAISSTLARQTDPLANAAQFNAFPGIE